MKNRAIIFLAWGDRCIKEVESCIKLSKGIQDYDIFLITDVSTTIQNKTLKVIRVSFEMEGYLRKTELVRYLPKTHESFLFLDSDTRVISDISLGFEKAEKYGIAMSPAPHYSMDQFYGFDKIMLKEGMDCKGQLQYNSGVIFFKTYPDVIKVLEQWKKLAFDYQSEFDNDQPYLSLALEQLAFNPYTLSISYNYRGFGDSISGIVRIWHSHDEMPENINEYKKPWPPRRAIPGEILFPVEGKNKLTSLRSTLERLITQLSS